MKDWLSSPKFYRVSKQIAVYCGIIASVVLSYGLLAGLLVAPIDYQQLSAVKIIYVHVPCAILSIALYTAVGLSSIVYLIWHIKLADMVAQASASLGIWFTLLALVSGALWGKPMWGAWWVWDARLTSELILFFLYAGYLGLRAAIVDAQVAAKNCAILAIVGLVDIPIIHYSVVWWNTLHQGSTLVTFGKPKIALSMAYPLLAVLVGLGMFCVSIVLMRARGELLWRERDCAWVRRELMGKVC